MSTHLHVSEALEGAGIDSAGLVEQPTSGKDIKSGNVEKSETGEEIQHGPTTEAVENPAVHDVLGDSGEKTLQHETERPVIQS